MKLPIIEKYAPIYAKSLNLDELKDGIIEISKAIKGKAYEDKRNELNNLLGRILFKYAILSYYDSNFIDYKRFIERTNDILKSTESSILKELINRYSILISNINEILEPYFISKRVLYDNDVLTQELDVITNSLNDIELVITKLNNLEDQCFESGVNLPSPKQASILEVTSFKEKIIKDKNALQYKENDKIANQYIGQLISYNFEYMPFVDFEKQANTILIHTPIYKEAELLAYAYSKKFNTKIATLNGSSLNNIEESKLEMLFESLDRNNYDIYIDDIEHIKPSIINKVYIKLVLHGKNNHKVFILDTKPKNTTYNDILSTIKTNNNLTSLDISYLYLSMPQYEELIQVLINKNILTSKDDEKVNIIQKEMPFIGFTGLNEIILSFISEKDWISKGKTISSLNNNNILNNYIKEIPNLSLFIDEGWKISDNIQSLKTTHSEFDYDRVRNINSNNIKKILSRDFNICEKCGNIVRYCLLAGEDVTTFEKLTEEEKKERINLAIGCLYSILEIDIQDFTCSICTNVGDDENIFGRNVQAGKIIELKRKLISSVSDDLIRTICHECFHSFQYSCIFNGFKSWYFEELGVGKSRIKQWTENNAVYIYPNKDSSNYNAYRYQIVEADANAFASDCIEASKQSWDKIDFE